MEGAHQATALGYGFRSTRNHTKIILGQIAAQHYVIEGSANLRSCSNLEQFSLTNSAALFDFHTAWIESVWKIAED